MLIFINALTMEVITLKQKCRIRKTCNFNEIVIGWDGGGTVNEGDAIKCKSVLEDFYN